MAAACKLATINVEYILITAKDSGLILIILASSILISESFEVNNGF